MLITVAGRVDMLTADEFREGLMRWIKSAAASRRTNALAKTPLEESLNQQTRRLAFWTILLDDRGI